MNKNLWKRAGLLLTASAMALSLVGCGGDEGTQDDAQSGGDTSTTEERVIHVGMMASVYPYCFLDDNDEIAG